MTTPVMTPLLVVVITLLLKAPMTTAQISSNVAPILLGLGSDACGQQCDFVYNPVCGSDGLSYPNYCFLSQAACTKPAITPFRYGPCRYPDPCFFVCNRMYNPVCGSDGRTYNNPCVLMYYACFYPNSGLFRRHVGSCVEEKECPATCPSTKNPVCGSDNRTYANPCSLLLQRCAGKNVTQAKDGPCITCPKSCTREYLPVCGSDGVTYASQCVLESQVCDGEPYVSTAYNGVCKDTSVQRPSSGGRRPPARRPPTSSNCPTACPTLYSPVCGSDGRTYGNECVLRTASCQDPTITKTINGECGMPLRPCPDVCPTSSSPVCGSDGVTYDNDCVLKATTCRDPTVTFFTSGTCESANASPPCPSFCTSNYLPVCGSDGRTYNNQCELERISCRNPEVTKRSNGECPIVTTAPARRPGTNTNTGTGAGSGVDSGSDCPNFCVRVYSPVCGTDGKTYYNPCLLNLVACRENRRIVTQSLGRCDEQTSKNSNSVNPQPNPSSSQTDPFSTQPENPCLRSCPFTDEPVCGSNDVTYTNECTLANARCTDDTLAQRYSGPCIRGV